LTYVELENGYRIDHMAGRVQNAHHALVRRPACAGFAAGRKMSDALSDFSVTGAVGTLLDSACLAQLRGLDPQAGSAFLHRVLSTYLRTLDVHCDRAEQCLVDADWQGLAQAAHALKSASASIGAGVFSGLCAAMEEAVRHGHPEKLPELMALFIDESVRVRSAVRHQLAVESQS
jgi:HPt (histidine-containing phosphotransfer) domain-containing protein